MSTSRFLLSCAVGLLLSSAIAGCHLPAPPRPRPEKAILERQIAELERLVRAPRTERVIPFDQALLSVDQALLGSLLNAALPYERVVGDQFRIRIVNASVKCEDGVALVRLSGRVSFADRPEEDAYAEATVYGALRDFALQPKLSVLRSQIDVIAFAVPQVKVNGSDTETGKGLLRDLARLRLEVFQGLDYTFDIPVRLQDVVLPEIESSSVHIDPASIPLQVTVTDVNALRGKLWISLRLQQSLVSASATAADTTRVAR